MGELKILSLLPAATEIVFKLGLENYLVGVSHGCDYPKKVMKLPKITSSEISVSLSSEEIDRRVKQSKHEAHRLFQIDEEILHKLKPNLILTQELCDVCAVSWKKSYKSASILDEEIKIISLEPESLGDILQSILIIGRYTGKVDESFSLVENLKFRLESGNLLLKNLKNIRKVLVIEWLEPIMVAGHWVPEMIERSGGMNVKTKTGDKSYSITRKEIVDEAPSIVIVAPCGFSINRTLREKKLIENLTIELKELGADFYLIDGDAYLTRPGPRIIDGVEIIREILHPEIFPRKHNLNSWQKFRPL